MFGGRRLLPIVTCLCVLAFAAGSCGDDTDSVERASVPTGESTTTSEATTTTEPAAPAFEALLADPALTPEQQVEAAYLHSWDIYLDALENGRTDYLDLAHRGDALALRTGIVHDLIAAGHSVVGDVEHAYDVQILSGDLAQVTDRYRNHLVLTDADSGEALEPDPDEVVEYRFTIVHEGGAWLVSFVE